MRHDLFSGTVMSEKSNGLTSKGTLATAQPQISTQVFGVIGLVMLILAR